MEERLAAKMAFDAVKTGAVEQLQELIEEDPNIVSNSTPFGSLLHVAADKGQFGIVKLLVANGAEVNQSGGIVGGNPLASAASSGHLEIVRYLRDEGAELDVSDPTRNPLFGAIHGGHTEVARFLVESGIDTSVRYTGENMTEMDAVGFAEEWGRTEIIEMLHLG